MKLKGRDTVNGLLRLTQVNAILLLTGKSSTMVVLQIFIPWKP